MSVAFEKDCEGRFYENVLPVFFPGVDRSEIVNFISSIEGIIFGGAVTTVVTGMSLDSDQDLDIMINGTQTAREKRLLCNFIRDAMKKWGYTLRPIYEDVYSNAIGTFELYEFENDSKRKVQFVLQRVGRTCEEGLVDVDLDCCQFYLKPMNVIKEFHLQYYGGITEEVIKRVKDKVARVLFTKEKHFSNSALTTLKRRIRKYEARGFKIEHDFKKRVTIRSDKHSIPLFLSSTLIYLQPDVRSQAMKLHEQLVNVFGEDYCFKAVYTECMLTLTTRSFELLEAGRVENPS
ncbi:hypothetical protein EB118_19480 [bacterium]|nr:hypothetical protein [Actinomycetota bacterium]NDG32245.1 hypothetical protein [bacterium]